MFVLYCCDVCLDFWAHIWNAAGWNSGKNKLKKKICADINFIAELGMAAGVSIKKLNRKFSRERKTMRHCFKGHLHFTHDFVHLNFKWNMTLHRIFYRDKKKHLKFVWKSPWIIYAMRNWYATLFYVVHKNKLFINVYCFMCGWTDDACLRSTTPLCSFTQKRRRPPVNIWMREIIHIPHYAGHQI